jgi:methylase of polypeptide subunit release factors
MNFEKELLSYIQNVKRASSEASKSYQFLMFMGKIFPSSNIGYIESKFPEIEKYVSFKSKTIVARGRIDSFLGNVIIEFESDVKKMKRRAEEQIKRYVSILWNNELKEFKKRADYVAVATDGIDFYVYRPETVKEGEIREEDVKLILVEEFNIERSKPEEVLRWLDVTFLSERVRIPTTEEFMHVFGVNTVFYAGVYKEMKKAINKFKEENKETFETLFFEWSKYLSIAYGSTVENEDFFIKHTYLSMLSKLMVYSFLYKGKIPVEDEEILDILNGKVFERSQIKNFFEEDFFSWIFRDPVKEIGIKIAKGILDVLAKYDLTKLNEDILKGLYENLLDPEERHDLGEVYTPDWLVEYILRDLLKENPKASVLDPACGSGTFLFIAIKLKKEFLKDKMNEAELLYHILENVKGIDIHPLAVLIAKTNYLIALGDLLETERHEIVLPIYMADSIRLIDEDKSSLGGIQVYKIPTIDDKTFFFLPCDFIEKRILESEAIDLLIDLVKELSEEFLKGGEIYKERVEGFLYQHVKEDEAKKYIDVIVQNVKIFAEKIIKRNKDTIWGYILKNKHKPLNFTYRKFDLIVGNPPWVVFNSIKNVQYQEFLKKQIKDIYKLTLSAKLITHMEIATLFFIRCSELYLKDNGKIVFVMPKSIFSGEQHSNFRSNSFERVKLGFFQIFDLENVSPLFNVPACVIFAKKNSDTSFPVKAKIFAGKLKRKNENYKQAILELKIKEEDIFLSQIGDRNFLSYMPISFKKKSSYYENFFQGATIVPRVFWFIKIEKPEFGFAYEKPYVKTSEQALFGAKRQWENIVFEGNIERKFLYSTILGTDIYPFSHTLTSVVLPIDIAGNKFRIIRKNEALIKYPLLAKWLDKAEKIWNKIRGEKQIKMDIYERIDYNQELTRQNPKKRFKVLYATAVTNIVGCVVDTHLINKEFNGFVADAGTYYYETDDEKEAYYLSCFFNSKIIDDALKYIQTPGLFGVRNIHKKVLELPIPRFNENNKFHKRLAELGKKASEKAQQKLKEILEKEYKNLEYLKPQHVAKIRKEIREHIKDELEEIDEIIQEILKENSKKESPLNKFIKN